MAEFGPEEIDVKSRRDDPDFDVWLQKNLEIIQALLMHGRDFFFDVQDDKVAGHHAHNIVAHSANVTSAIKTVGQYGSGVVYVFPTGNTIDYVSSNNIADTHEITIWGLIDDYVPHIQTVTLNGRTPVALDTPMFRVNFFYNDTGTPTLGTVFLWDSPSGAGTEHTLGVPTVASTVKAFITSSTANGSDEHHLGSVFTVPAGMKGSIIFGKTTVTDNKALELSFWAAEKNKVPKLAHHIDILNNNYDYFFKTPAPVPEKSDIYVLASQAGGGDAEVSAHYDVIIKDMVI